MRELWIYLRCVYRNEVTCTALLFMWSFLGLATIAAEFGPLWAGILIALSCVSLGVFIFSGAALDTFYHYAVTAAAIGTGTNLLKLSPNLKPGERRGALMACYDLGCPYVAA